MSAVSACGAGWGYETLAGLLAEDAGHTPSLAGDYRCYTGLALLISARVADHVKGLRSGDKYLGLTESAYLAELLRIPIAYYTPNNDRSFFCCMGSCVWKSTICEGQLRITGGSSGPSLTRNMEKLTWVEF